jgi:hypothetical protein
MAPNPTFQLGVLLEEEKLNIFGNNYMEWYRNVWIVLRSAKDCVLLRTLGDLPSTTRKMNPYL